MSTTCSMCRKDKESFAISPRTNTITKICVECWEVHYAPRAKSSEHHQERRRLENRSNKTRQIARNRNFLLELLVNSKCMDCGYSNWIALDFDHRESDTKENEVSRMVNNGVTLDRIKLEIAKCDIVCSNCHRIRTATRAGSWRVRERSPA